MSRISRDEWVMELALTTAKRGTCLRRQVGCVAMNARGHVLATGYNGVAAGLPHCNEKSNALGRVHQGVVTHYNHPYYPNACSGAAALSGTQLDLCHAIHAEMNCLLQCRDVYAIDTVYVTVSPCVTCTKLLLNTSCGEIVFAERYAHEDTARAMWEAAGRSWRHLS